MLVEKIDLWIKSIVAFFGALLSYALDGLGWAFTVLLIFMAADYVTGLMAGFINKNLESGVAFKGLAKKVYVIILVSCIYLLEYAGLDIAGFAGDGVAIAYIVVEFISITENGGKIGAPIPKVIRDAIAILKREDDNNGHQNHA